MTKILKQPDILKILGVTRTTIWRWRHAGIFPNPIQLGANSIGWTENQIEEWLESKQKK